MRKSESRRRFWKTESTTPCFFAKAHSSAASVEVAATGFSTTTCLPAAMACFAKGTWVSLGVEMITRSMSSVSSSSKERTICTSGYSSFARSVLRSYTFFSSKFGSAWMNGA